MHIESQIQTSLTNGCLNNQAMYGQLVGWQINIPFQHKNGLYLGQGQKKVLGLLGTVGWQINVPFQHKKTLDTVMGEDLVPLG